MAGDPGMLVDMLFDLGSTGTEAEVSVRASRAAAVFAGGGSGAGGKSKSASKRGEVGRRPVRPLKLCAGRACMRESQLARGVRPATGAVLGEPEGPFCCCCATEVAHPGASRVVLCPR